MNLCPLIFEYIDKFNDQRKIRFTCSYKDKFSDIIKQYRVKSKDYHKNETFIYNGQQINPMNTIAELGITPESIIEVIQHELVKGGNLAIQFTDVSKNKIKELGFSEDAPSYRYACQGINIFGDCHCKKCSAFKKEVVIPIEGEKFDLIKNKEDFFCPECGSYIKPKTVGFYQCKYSIYGKKMKTAISKILA